MHRQSELQHKVPSGDSKEAAKNSEDSQNAQGDQDGSQQLLKDEQEAKDANSKALDPEGNENGETDAQPAKKKRGRKPKVKE